MNPAPPVTVSVVVVTYWTGEVLEACLDSVLAQDGVTEVIVVDNGNPATVRRRLDAWAATEPRGRILRPSRNLGFAAGCNLGAASARGDLIAFVNPDCVLGRDVLLAIKGVLAQRPDAWLCGARLENPDGSEQRGSRREMLTPWRAFVEYFRLDRLAPQHPYFRRFHQFETGPLRGIVEVPTVSGAFMVVHKGAWERVGGMDENLFLHLDDSDLCMRILDQGGKVLFCADVPVTHHRSTSDVSRLFIDWHKTRGTPYFFYKHFHRTYPGWFLILISTLIWLRFALRLPFALAVELPEMLRRRRRRQAG